jgi:uncharacterized membrane protein
MITQPFTYQKQKTIQALRYHFISRKEIKVMLVLVNVFSLTTAVLFFLKKITPVAFLTGSSLWLLMMLLFWLIMPRMVYSQNKTFKETMQVDFADESFTIHMGTNQRAFAWTSCSQWMESPHFFHIYFNQRSFFLIPKDSFSDEHEARQWLKGRLKKG